jgi:hypothetical protein
LEVLVFFAIGSFLSGNFGAFLSRFGKANRDGLFSARHTPAFAAFTRTQRAMLLSVHRALHSLAGCSAISRHEILLESLNRVA